MIFSVENLTISFLKNREYTPIVRELTMHIFAGEMLGVVGESGSGKSLTNLALMGLLPSTAKLNASKFEFKGRNLLTFRPKDWQAFRGNEIAIIFQNSKSAMNPAMKIKTQLTECIKKMRPGVSKKNIQTITSDLLEQVGLSSAEINLDSYPHELSAGLAQRFMIAMALTNNPSLLIADEITTGLDRFHKREILSLLDTLRREKNMAVLLVSHDINLIKEYTQRMQVMYSGELMEAGLTQSIIEHPKHPYTKGLMNCLPKEGDKKHKQHLNTIEGLVLPITEETTGCRFYNRCPEALASCTAMPRLKQLSDRQEGFVNCLLWGKS